MKKIEEIFCIRSEDDYLNKLNQLTRAGYRNLNKKIVHSSKLGYYFIVSVNYRDQKNVEK